ncbi:Phosphoglycerate mutase [Hydrogenobaculum sp. Y04AAS1]|uniref:histidine phosphatase family protein n=1 Tax=Hydrogenobaculum sp. (strain Y04AAS1) TaxID=380749 RepID=UPI00015BD301|nr:Phosphoglycerate mutase [Hydrogenobaculum sp. Y04AAS1]HCT66220.1 histidine phosphatase family protein [Hydrogenobaculum sp.]
MCKLILVRHAESQWNPIGRYQGILDPDLSQRGELQAKALAIHIKKEFPHVEAIYSSPLTRTRKTAQAIGNAIGKDIILDKRLIEIDHGEWAGELVDDIEKKYKEDFETWMKAPHKIRFPKGESLKEVFDRTIDFISFIKATYKDKTVVAVSHSVPIRVFYCMVLGIDLSHFWAFGCDNASYSILSLGEQDIIQKLNISCHLGELYAEAHRAI